MLIINESRSSILVMIVILSFFNFKLKTRRQPKAFKLQTTISWPSWCSRAAKRVSPPLLFSPRLSIYGAWPIVMCILRRRKRSKRLAFLCHYRIFHWNYHVWISLLFFQIRIMRSPWMDPRSLGTILLLMIATVNAGKFLWWSLSDHLGWQQAA